MTDYDKLRQLAQAATGGKWVVNDLRNAPDGNRDCLWVDTTWDQGDYVTHKTVVEMNEDEGLNVLWSLADAEFIAAANPTVVLALLDELRDAKARLADAWDLGYEAGDIDNDPGVRSKIERGINLPLTNPYRDEA